MSSTANDQSTLLHLGELIGIWSFHHKTILPLEIHDLPSVESRLDLTGSNSIMCSASLAFINLSFHSEVCVLFCLFVCFGIAIKMTHCSIFISVFSPVMTNVAKFMGSHIAIF